MQIHKLLESHEKSFHPSEIKGALGDAFLLTENPIFLNVREISKSIGFRFVKAWPQYVYAPFLELHQISKTKKIPYTPNAKILQRYKALSPRGLGGDIAFSLRLSSYHFHESCHCIANRFFFDGSIQNKRQIVLRTLMSESVANSAECLANIFVDSSVHREFLRLNSYWTEESHESRFLLTLVNKFDLRNTLKLIFISFLFSNFLYKSLDKKDLAKVLKRILPELSWSKSRLNMAHRVFDIAFGLNIRFRVSDTRTHFNLLGIPGPMTSITDFDFVTLLIEDTKLFKSIDVVLDLICYGKKSQYF